MSPEDAQLTADVAQFYLAAASGQYGAALGHPFVDVEKCEQKLREVAELGYRPRDPTKLLETLMRSAEAWPLFPGEQDPPLL